MPPIMVSDLPSMYMKAVSTCLCPLSRKAVTMSRLCWALARPPNAMLPRRVTGFGGWEDDISRPDTNFATCTRTPRTRWVLPSPTLASQCMLKRCSEEAMGKGCDARSLRERRQVASPNKKKTKKRRTSKLKLYSFSWARVELSGPNKKVNVV